MVGWQQHITHAQGTIKGTATKVKAATKSSAASTMPAPLQPCPLVSAVITVTKGPRLFISTNLLSKSKSCVSPIMFRQLVLRVKEQGLLKHIPLAWFIPFCLTLSGLKRSWIIKSGQSYLGQPCNNSVQRWELKYVLGLWEMFSIRLYKIIVQRFSIVSFRSHWTWRSRTKLREHYRYFKLTSTQEYF